MAWSDPHTYSNAEVPNAALLNTDIRDNLRELWHELAYVEFTANVTVAGTVVSSGAITYSARPTLIEFFAPGWGAPTDSQLSLKDSATDLGQIAGSGGAFTAASVYVARRLTPTAASHTYLFSVAGTSGFTLYAGAGGAGVNTPGFIRITQKGV